MREVRRRLYIFLSLFLLIAAIGTIGFMKLENLSLADAFYYNIVTMSTVGYGDIHPTHQTSRLFAIFLIVMGGGTFLGVIANATEMLILRREIQNRNRKINMVLGVFFSEVGYHLLRLFAGYDHAVDKIVSNMQISGNWTAGRFSEALKTVEGYDAELNAAEIDLKQLKLFLSSKRDFLLIILENPMLFEHEAFSDLLLSVFHLLDELGNRTDLRYLPASDLRHLSGDINRIYKKLMMRWMIYMSHLKNEYPYLFSLAMRTNPFDSKASAVVTD